MFNVDINNLLSYAKYHAHQVEIQQSQVSLVNTMDNWLDVMMGRALSNHVTLIVRYDSFCIQNPQIVVDRERMRQVVVNLVDNAIKYSDENGSVEILIGRNDSNTLLLEVVDHGRGIAKNKMENLFVPFVQGERALEGCGLGLSMVYVLLDILHDFV